MAKPNPDDNDWFLNCPPHLEPVRDCWVKLCERVCKGEKSLDKVCDEIERAFRLARHRHTESVAKAWKCPCRKCKIRRVAAAKAAKKSLPPQH
jgi:hypothetical protein